MTNNGVLVTNGLFTVAIDFGSGVLNGATNWLQIGVETNGANNFTTLTPRQQLTPAPYAIFAESSSNLLGTLPASQLTTTSEGYGNFFAGPSGNSTTSGSFNTAIGDQALINNTTGTENTANGESALIFNTTGSYNTAYGLDTLYDNYTGCYNTANGTSSLGNNTAGSYNTADGFEALNDNYNGYYNTAEGYQALFACFNGTNNIAIGYEAGYNFREYESSNIDIGNPGLEGENNIIRIGSSQSQTYIAGVINGDGGGLTNLNLNAAQLTSIGNTNGAANGNFFIGGSGNSTTSGSDNTAIGSTALLANTSGSANTANGGIALSANMSGSVNTANGFYALANNQSGSFNTADGAVALLDNTSGSNNIALGFAAGDQITTGDSNIDIGNEGLSTDTNIIRIGSGQSQTFIAGVINGDGSGLTNLNFNNQSNTGTNTTTRLLFPFASNQAGYDTGIIIANTTADPFGTAATNGTATIYFYGPGAPNPNTYTTPTIAAGSTFSGIVSVLAPGFQGYLIVVCNFPLAHGYGFLTETGAKSYSAMTPALVLPPQRSMVLPESLGQ